MMHTEIVSYEKLQNLPPLIPPFRFALVEEGLYRSAYPTSRNFRFLKRLKLKTILSLTPNPPTKDLEDFCESQDINIIHTKLGKVKDDVKLSYSSVGRIVQTMVTSESLPLLIHCLDGAEGTGIMVMCLRKLQRWQTSCYQSEYRRFTKGQLQREHAEYVENFNVDTRIKLPPSTPKWMTHVTQLRKYRELHQQELSKQGLLSKHSSHLHRPFLAQDGKRTRQPPLHSSLQILESFHLSAKSSRGGLYHSNEQNESIASSAENSKSMLIKALALETSSSK